MSSEKCYKCSVFKRFRRFDSQKLLGVPRIQVVKELNIKGIHVGINHLLDEMSGIRRVSTFFGNIDKPEKVRTFSRGSELAEQIEQIYQLKEKYAG